MKNIERWLEKGYINQELAEVLNNDLKQEQEKVCKTAMLCVLYTIGALLIGSGVVAFVASNDWILDLLTQTPILKVLILLILAVSSLVGGYQIGINKQNFLYPVVKTAPDTVQIVSNYNKILCRSDDKSSCFFVCIRHNPVDDVFSTCIMRSFW